MEGLPEQLKLDLRLDGGVGVSQAVAECTCYNRNRTCKNEISTPTTEDVRCPKKNGAKRGQILSIVKLMAFQKENDLIILAFLEITFLEAVQVMIWVCKAGIRLRKLFFFLK